MASKVCVYFGRRSLPWHRFVELARAYRRNNPTDERTDAIFNLHNLRQTQYSGSKPTR